MRLQQLADRCEHHAYEQHTQAQYEYWQRHVTKLVSFMQTAKRSKRA